MPQSDVLTLFGFCIQALLIQDWHYTFRCNRLPNSAGSVIRRRDNSDPNRRDWAGTCYSHRVGRQRPKSRGGRCCWWRRRGGASQHDAVARQTAQLRHHGRPCVQAPGPLRRLRAAQVVPRVPAGRVRPRAAGDQATRAGPGPDGPRGDVRVRGAREWVRVPVQPSRV